MPLSVDTFYADVAAAAVEAGATMVNDVSGGSMDHGMHAQVRARVGGALADGSGPRHACGRLNAGQAAVRGRLVGASAPGPCPVMEVACRLFPLHPATTKGLLLPPAGCLSTCHAPPQVADLGVPYVLMHMRGTPQDMQQRRHTGYADVVADVAAELAGVARRAMAAGIEPWRLVLDPGLGFAKTQEGNLQLMAQVGMSARHEWCQMAALQAIPVLLPPARGPSMRERALPPAPS